MTTPINFNVSLIISVTIILKCILVPSAAQNTQWATTPPLQRIAGGRPAKFGEVPYQVRVERNDGTLCGGTLLDHCGLKYVITAAHCVYKGRPKSISIYPASQYQVVGADLDQNSYQPREQWFNVKHITAHQDYDARYIMNDIALLFLDRHVFESLGLEHIELAQIGWEDPEFCRVSGWGTADWTGEASPLLQVAEVPVMEWHACKKLKHPWNTFLGPKEFCLGNDNKAATGTCRGDSGGPIVGYNYTMQQWYLYGIDSYGVTQACGLKGSASVATRVINYLDWIKGAAQGWLDAHGTGNNYTNGASTC